MLDSYIASTWNSACILGRKSAQELLKIYNEASLNSLEESSRLSKLVDEFPFVFSGFGKLKNVCLFVWGVYGPTRCHS